MTNGLNSMIQEIKNGKKIDQGTFVLVLKQPQTTKETKIHEILLHFVQNPDKQPLEDVIGYLKAAIRGMTVQKTA
ncbi:hypothetical protein [Wolbachia endosymbiont of Tettigetta isshikii]|uniref:hypothetical protein n=1 Tax=Wolbachia endosymbiont of Tettigetta isshikii TaxID=3239093 RepID=UPI00397F0994